MDRSVLDGIVYGSIFFRSDGCVGYGSTRVVLENGKVLGKMKLAESNKHNVENGYHASWLSSPSSGASTSHRIPVREWCTGCIMGEIQLICHQRTHLWNINP